MPPARKPAARLPGGTSFRRPVPYRPSLDSYEQEDELQIVRHRPSDRRPALAGTNKKGQTDVAKLIEVMSTIGPKLVYGRTIELDELAEWTANRSGLTAEEVERVLKAVRSAVIHYCRAGGAVRLPGMGRVRPAIDRTGRVRARIVPDPVLDKAIALYPRFEAFLQQGMQERADYAGSLESLGYLFGA